MTTTREALVLPLLLLTVTLLGGLRVAETVRLVPPTVVALVLAAALLGTLVRGGVLTPERLMHPGRTPLENLSGAVVMATLFAASAQLFNLLTPEKGLLFVIFSTYFFVQIMTALAGATTRDSLLRSLIVLFAAAFLLRFAVLESLYAPQGGLLTQVLTAVLQGVSLGSIEYQPHAAITGYAGFFTLMLYLIALALLPGRRRGDRGAALTGRRHTAIAGQVLLALLAVAASGCGVGDGVDTGGGSRPTGDAAEAAVSMGAMRRANALRAARVWHLPPQPIGEVDFARNAGGDDGFKPAEEVACRYVDHRPRGTTPKFRCALANGQEIKVKYGGSAELAAEVAATRLLTALGFGADRMYVVRRIRCAGCPRFPFATARCTAQTGLITACLGGGDAGVERTFEPAVIERPLPGRSIESAGTEGWSWYEMDQIEPARGGSSRAEVDAFRLLAVVLGHWDNKASNQRLLCPEGHEAADGGCDQPLAMIQDAGATFGPLKLDLHNWRGTPVWADRGTCTVSMRRLPYRGATFPDRRISEEGRQLLAGLLGQISERQMIDLFTASRIVSFDHPDGEGRDATAWAAALAAEIAEDQHGQPCPG
ncbi:MAG: hypothetical protein ABI603_13605 [Acidobacteriota bacterium]